MKRRDEQGYFHNIVKELSIENTLSYREIMRMSHQDFNYIFSVIEQDITPHQILGGHKAMNSKARLTLAIRFIATEESFRSLKFQFRMSTSAISYIVCQVCCAIVKDMGDFLKFPSSPEEWLDIAKQFEDRRYYPNCIGAIDGKHIVIQPPLNAGSHFYNYNHTHSVVLLAVIGPDYECIYADTGTNGRVSDGGVWYKCSLSRKIQMEEIAFPLPRCFSNGVVKFPFVFVADDAFARKPYIMKPYPQTGFTDDKRICNYRHSHARRI